MNPSKSLLQIALALAFSGGWQGLVQAQVQEAIKPLSLSAVDVIGTVLLPGIGTPLRDVPANVQVLSAQDMALQRQTNLVEFIEQNPGSISVNSAQGNPFQPDISFRGFTASPLLGLPQGLSVFQDGVRINEAFGDSVNWDLLPQSAISSLQLIPGSNPVFGLNTLGGALAIHTKSGRENPGGAVEFSTGSFGRKIFTLEQGGSSGPLDYFFTANRFDDDGWAEHNPSRIRQVFGKVGYKTGVTDIDLSLTAADNTLQGTQTLPLSFANDVRKAYTYPDSSHNQLGFLNLKGSHYYSDNVLVGGNLYYRKYKNQGISSNVNNNFGQVDATTGQADSTQANNARAAIDQTGYGMGLQMTLLDNFFGRANQFVLGASSDFGNSRFTQDNQNAQFTSDRGTQGTSDFVQATDATTHNRYDGLFFADTWSVSEQWTLTGSGRYNRALVQIADQTGNAPKLNSENKFSRFNPAIGVNFNPTPRLTSYVNYSEGMRAPTPIELTCADPEAPCKLPNNFLADPPLKMVVSRTIEAGARGKIGASSQWSAAIYNTDLEDDIAFINSSGTASNAGYFQNVGKSRRQGLELSAASRFGALALSANYSFINATYESSFTELSPNNSTANGNGAVQVSAGNRIPGIPKQTLKFRLDYAATSQWSVGGNVVLNSAIFARGDENNLDARGKIAGYAVVNLDSRYKVSPKLELFGRINNALGKQYSNFGVLGQNYFTGADRSFDGNNPNVEQFRSYAAPRGIWVGVRTSWL
jgi:outer membrane receptor protein involved in Fe transport